LCNRARRTRYLLAMSPEPSSTAWILTVVSSIVSVLVIVIGLFFSSRFMHLHAENQVSKALLERIEKELEKKNTPVETDARLAT
ncbi:hypothetical protein, partial [Ruegeria sp. HKCCA5763]|uniref:hypothetical protein n=1 Tax=Ruegeria sp. HKCCA5763 TaxID=2682987 RepID=UPI001C2C7476